MISCDEATTICDKSQYNEASSMEKVKLKFHFLFCKICKRYTRQNTTMSELFRMKCHEVKQQKMRLSEADKLALKKKLEQFS